MLVYAFGFRRALLALGMIGGVFLFSFAPYLPDAAGQIVHQVLLYASVDYGYGLAPLLPDGLHKLIFYAGMLMLPVWVRRRGLLLAEALLACSLLFLILTPGFGIQMAALVLVFGALEPSIWYMLMASVTATLVYPYPLLAASAPVLNNLLWVMCVWRLTMIYRKTGHRMRLLSSTEVNHAE
jgi:hypothetical protein